MTRNYLMTSQITAVYGLSRFRQSWHKAYEPYAPLKSDNVITVSPGGNIMWTCGQEFTQESSKCSHDSVKPVEMMGMLNLYGPTVPATEGEEEESRM